jgi:hypothetical protein
MRDVVSVVTEVMVDVAGVGVDGHACDAVARLSGVSTNLPVLP